jgi:hypothetical protein
VILVPVRPVSVPSESDSSSAVLAAVVVDLAALGLHARVLTEWVAGEPDVRLQVWQDEGTATGELLCPAPGGKWPAHLDAVRIRDDDREVWRIPHTCCAAADIVRFLCDLLLVDPPALRQRYSMLG